MKAVTLTLLLASVLISMASTADTAKETLLNEIAEVLERGLEGKGGLKNKAGKIIKNKNRALRALACPRNAAILGTPSVSPLQSVCRRHTECGEGEKCCDGQQGRQCVKAISKRPRIGQCPMLTQINDGCSEEAQASACRFDSECEGEDDKCCMTLCGYKECLSVRQNIACPVPQTLVSGERTEVTCTKDTECALEEKCCDWNSNKHCLKGLSKTPKRGPCATAFPNPNAVCVADQPSCSFDTECPGVNEKCCLNPDCGHRECRDMNRDFYCPTKLNTETQDVLDTVSECNPQNSTCEGFTKVCCAAGVDTAGDTVHKCIQGEFRGRKPGHCPAMSDLSDPSGTCLPDFKGNCEFDDECFGEHKCCKTSCGYSMCVQVQPPSSNERKELLKRVLALLNGDK